MTNEKIVYLYPLSTFSAFCYIFIVFWVAITHKLLKFSAFLSCVRITKYVKFQIPRYKGFKVGILRISPVGKNALEQIRIITEKIQKQDNHNKETFKNRTA